MKVPGPAVNKMYLRRSPCSTFNRVSDSNLSLGRGRALWFHCMGGWFYNSPKQNIHDPLTDSDTTCRWAK